MKHLFIVNTVAGRGRGLAVLNQLRRYKDELDLEIYTTKGRKDATTFVRDFCEKHPDPVRVYACGGDGTLQEVASGLIGFPQATLVAYACGSGNDFVKCFGEKESFLDIDRLLKAEPTPIDMIALSNGRYAINACHFGFDSAVATTMDKVRHKKLIGGKNAYLTGVVHAFFTNMKTRCTVTVDGEVLNPDGELLLCTIANGKYVGGKYLCAPRASYNDGLLDVCLVKPVSRARFAALIHYYEEGTHLDDPKFRDLVVWRRGKHIEISSPDPNFACALDGEVFRDPHFEVTVMENALSFAVPEPIAESEEKTPVAAVAEGE